MNKPLLMCIALKAFMVVLLTTLAVGMSPRASAAAFIVKDGKPLATIVIAENPTRKQKLAAQELQKYIRKITGAELVIGTTPDASRPVTIYVGASEHTSSLGLNTHDLEYGAYRIKSGDGYLAMVGRDDNYFMDKPGDGGPVFPAGRKDRDVAQKAWHDAHGDMWTSPFWATYKGYNKELGVWDTDEQGSLNAVNDFLRFLGVRWYMPGDFGEVCPTLTSIELPVIDQTVKPEWSQREIHFHSANPFQISDTEMLWQLRLGLRPQEEGIGGHGTTHLLGTDWVKKNKPEFFALYGSERATTGQGKPCYSSKGLLESALGFSAVMFDNYGKQISSLMPTDGYTAFCHCGLCKGKSTPDRGFQGMMSDYVWAFMNQAAAQSASTHPGKHIMNYAYNTYLLPPESIEKFHPNLRVGICGGRKDFYDPAKKQAMMDIREGFLKKIPSGKISLWQYYNIGPGQPVYYPQIIAEDLRSLKGKVDGTMIEYTRKKRVTEADPTPDLTLAASHLNLWLTTRLWWNPESEQMWWTRGRSVDALLDEYYVNFYGPASKEMKTYIEFCEQHWPLMQRKPEPIDQAFALIETARAAAGEDSIYAQRVQWVMDSLEPMKIIREQLKVGRDENPVAKFTELDRKTQVKLDGRFDESFWDKLETYQLNEVVAGEPLENKTTFKLAWVGENLYIGIHCHEQAMDKLHVPAKADGDNLIFDGDSIEILLETQTHAYYQIAVDPMGHVNDLDRPNSIIIGKTGKYDSKWDAGVEVATHKGKDFWTLEIKIPAMGASQEEILPFFGVAGDKPTHDSPWYFNVCRVRKVDLPERELSTFSPTGESGFHYMRKFARLSPR